VTHFYAERGLTDPRSEAEARKVESAAKLSPTEPKTPDDLAQKVGVVLTTQDESVLEQIKHRYFFCQVNASVTVIKKFISLQLYETTSKHNMVSYNC